MSLMNLRRLALGGVLCALELVGCAGAPKPKDSPPGPELELAYDQGLPSERPLLPPPAFEWLIKFEPNLPAYRPVRLRLLVAQPGPLRLALYAADANERPGPLLHTIERTYAKELTSNGQDGKWLLETLTALPVQTGPLFVGISTPTPGNDAGRLWATAEPAAESAPHLFQRDAEPSTALQSSRLLFAPLVRLAITPTAPPPASSSAAMK